MGLFSKRKAEPISYPAVMRLVHVPATTDAVVAHLEEYSGLWSPKRAQQHEVLVAQAVGWSAVRLPDEVHPWQLHNLAFWMLDCPGRRDGDDVIAESAAGPGHRGYVLIKDPELGDALCGWDEDGAGWTVNAPDNDIVRGEDVPTPREGQIPSGYDDWKSVPVLLEDPGRGMNEGNESTLKSRRALRDRHMFMYS